MKPTIVGLVTPHLLRVTDIARDAEKGLVVDWQLRDTVARTVEDLGQQYNGPDLLAAYVQGLEAAAREAGKARMFYSGVLQSAAAQAARSLKDRG